MPRNDQVVADMFYAKRTTRPNEATHWSVALDPLLAAISVEWMAQAQPNHDLLIGGEVRQPVANGPFIRHRLPRTHFIVPIAMSDDTLI